MHWIHRDTLILALCAVPFVYYVIAIYSAWRYFRRPRVTPGAFTPPVSVLKPVRGLDPEAYENFASFCRQDYPDYEIVFCLDADDSVAAGMVEQLKSEFPQRSIRALFGSLGTGSNDKSMKLTRLVKEAAHEIVVISDSDVRARPDYLRRVVAPHLVRDAGPGERAWQARVTAVSGAPPREGACICDTQGDGGGCRAPPPPEPGGGAGTGWAGPRPSSP